jgi:hypothetical protein
MQVQVIKDRRSINEGSREGWVGEVVESSPGGGYYTLRFADGTVEDFDYGRCEVIQQKESAVEKVFLKVGQEMVVAKKDDARFGEKAKIVSTATGKDEMYMEGYSVMLQFEDGYIGRYCCQSIKLVQKTAAAKKAELTAKIEELKAEIAKIDGEVK